MPGGCSTISRTVRILWAVSLWAWLAGGEIALAQGSATPPAVRATHPGYRSWTSEDRLRLLTKSLDLSVSQQSQVKEILERRQQQAVQMRGLDSASALDRARRLQDLDRRTVEQIKRVLTPAQLRLYDPQHAAAP
jgi:hypothetical protein